MMDKQPEKRHSSWSDLIAHIQSVVRDQGNDNGKVQATRKMGRPDILPAGSMNGRRKKRSSKTTMPVVDPRKLAKRKSGRGLVVGVIGVGALFLVAASVAVAMVAPSDKPGKPGTGAATVVNAPASRPAPLAPKPTPSVAKPVSLPKSVPSPAPKPTPKPAPSGSMAGLTLSGINLTVRPMAKFEDGKLMMEAAGADIWYETDSFLFAHRPSNGDGSSVIKVESLEGDHLWVKAGIMIRSSLAADAAHVTIFATRGHGVSFQVRPKRGAKSLRLAAEATGTPPKHRAQFGRTTNSKFGQIKAPVWLKLVRQGNRFTGYCSTDGNDWQCVAWTDVDLPVDARVGIAQVSHVAGTNYRAVYSNIAINGASAPTELTPAILSPATVQPLLPEGWHMAIVGDMPQPPQATFNGADCTITAGGADIGGRADALGFVCKEVTGNCVLTAKLASVKAANRHTMPVVMFRESADVDARMATVFKVKFACFRHRKATGLEAQTDLLRSERSRMGWLRIVRDGAEFRGYTSKQGHLWLPIGASTINMSTRALAGIGLCARHETQQATARFSDISIENTQSVLALTRLELVSVGDPGKSVELFAGAEIKLSELGRELNIRAICTHRPGSVKFKWGMETSIQNDAPYHMAGDSDTGVPDAWTPEPGEYELLAVPYTERQAQGKAGDGLVIKFTVVE